MSLKNNFLFNCILTVAGYIFPIITFPYVSRVLGVENIGICNFIDGVIDYYILFATLGIGSVGIREIAKCADDQNQRNTVFSSLIFISFISTSLVLMILVISINTVPQFEAYKSLLWIGISKLIFSLFLIEWLFQGMQNFKYITIRAILIRALFVVAVFIFVKNKEDYIIYYVLICSTIAINAFFNVLYSRKYVKFSIKNIQLKHFIKPFIVFGLNKVLISLYTTFNVIYLGLISSKIEVGYYTTSIKLFGIIIAIFSALTGVIVPKMSFYIANEQFSEVQSIVDKTTNILLTISLPIIIFSEFFAKDIINIIAGSGYEGAIIPFMIVMPLMLIIGLAQIYNQQLLMCLDDNKGMLITTLTGAIVGIALNVFLVKTFYSIGSAFSWFLTEVITLCLAIYFVRIKIHIRFPLKEIFNNLLLSIPYILILFFAKTHTNNLFLSSFISIVFSILYFLLLHLFIKKNEIVIRIIVDLKDKFKF
nr:oligosaccharide flippase family protein [uncultured Flavobacterium sp.]